MPLYVLFGAFFMSFLRLPSIFVANPRGVKIVCISALFPSKVFHIVKIFFVSPSPPSVRLILRVCTGSPSLKHRYPYYLPPTPIPSNTLLWQRQNKRQRQTQRHPFHLSTINTNSHSIDSDNLQKIVIPELDLFWTGQPIPMIQICKNIAVLNHLCYKRPWH